MDWIRRNWPDLLIGFALLAVISGIVATLLTGGTFFPLGGGGNQSTLPSQQASVQQPPADPTPQRPPQVADDPAGEPAGVSALPLLGERDESAAETPPQAEEDADAPVDPFADLPAEDPDTLPQVVPLRPGEAAESAAAAAAGQTPAPQSQPQAPAQTQQPAAAPTPPAQQQTPAAAPAASGEAPSAEVPYTVGVGAFLSADNANRQADVFRQAGYPVVVAQQDEFTVVLLGPYAARSEAERVQNSVASGGFGVSPIVYTFQGEDSDAAAAPAQPAEAPTQAPAPPAAAAEPAAESTPAPAASATAAGRYLQVGAYSSSENAGAQADVLTGLGYEVLQQQDGALIRVLVGPYPEAELSAARNRLAAQGIDSVPR